MAPTDLAAATDPAATAAGLPAAPLHDRMGIVLTAASPERVTGTMPVAGNTQPYGLLHGGASAVLAEGLASFAAHLHASAMGRIAVGVDLNATHHRAVRAGLVHGEAAALHLGRSMASYEVVLRDDAGRRVCTARVTCMLRERPPGSPAGG
jgi:uncharacterized protein (TIGR00369 family)